MFHGHRPLLIESACFRLSRPHANTDSLESRLTARPDRLPRLHSLCGLCALEGVHVYCSVLKSHHNTWCLEMQKGVTNTLLVHTLESRHASHASITRIIISDFKTRRSETLALHDVRCV